MGKWNAVKFRNAEVNPPSNLYLEDASAFRVTTNSGGTMAAGSSAKLSYRILTPPDSDNPNGNINIGDIDVKVGAGQSVTNMPLREGFLLSAEIRPGTAVGGAFVRGAVFVVVELVQSIAVATGAVIPLQTIISDYITSGSITNFPSGVVGTPASGQGVEFWVNPANPAPGVELLTIFTGKIRRRLTHVRYTLTTTAVLGNRVPSIVLITARPNEERIFPLDGSVGPLSVVDLHWDIFPYPRPALSQNLLTPRNPVIFGRLPMETLTVRATGAVTMRTDTVNLDPIGDQISDVHYAVEQWADF